MIKKFSKRIKKITSIKPNAYIILSVVLFISMVGYYYILNRFGFYMMSDDSIGDYINQHIPLSEYLRNMYLKLGFDMQFLPNIGLGHGISHFVYYGAFSPMMIFFIIFKDFNVLLVFQLLQIIVIISSIVLGSKFINLYYNNLNKSIAASSLVLTGAALFTLTYNNYMFIYPLPFLFLTLIGIKKENSILYVIGLTSIFYVNYMYSHIALIVIIMFVLVWELDNFKKYFLFCIRNYILVLLLSMPILTTQLSIIIGGSRTSDVVMNFSHVNKYFLNIMFLGRYSYGQPVIPLFIILCGFFTKSKKAIVSSFLILVLFASNDFNYFLNAFQYIEFRHIMMFTPIMLLLLHEIDVKVKSNIKIAVFIISTLISFRVMINNLWGSVYKQNFDFEELIYAIVIFVTLIIIMQSINFIKKNPQLSTTIIFILFMFIINNNTEKVTGDGFYNISECENFSEFRTSKDITPNNEVKSNYIENTCEMSTDIYLSMINYNLTNLYNDVYGVPQKYSKAKSIYYNDRVHNTFMSVNQVVDDKGNYTKLDYTSFPIIFFTDNVVFNDKILYQDDNLTASKYLLNGFFSNEAQNEQEDMFEYETYSDVAELEFNHSEDYVGNIVLDDVEETGVYGIEIVLDENYCEDASITIEGIMNTKTRCTYAYYNGNTTFNYWIEASSLSDGLDYTLSGRGNIKSVKYIHISEDELNVEGSFKSIEDVEYSSNKISMNINSEEGYIMTTIPFDSNFKVLVNGKEVDIEKVNGGYLGFQVDYGENEIEISYSTKYLSTSIFISITTAALCILAVVLKKRKKKVS